MESVKIKKGTLGYVKLLASFQFFDSEEELERVFPGAKKLLKKIRKGPLPKGKK